MGVGNPGYFGLTACATTQSGLKGPSLSNDINIIAPSSDLRKDIAAFSGKWVGTWEVGTEIILVVKEIDDTWAHVIYSWGDNPKFNIQAGYRRGRWQVISEPKPQIVTSGLEFFESYFEMKDSNTLEAHGERSWLGWTGAEKHTY